MEIREILQKNNFRFKKSLGQNFITDGGLLGAIVRDAGITERDTVVEIGAGAGSLTRVLAKQAKKVISFEVDYDLESVLSETLKGLDNTEVHFEDVLKISDDKFLDIVKGPFKVVANLPYYITTPLIMRFIESVELPVISLTVMVQKEVAQRLSALPNTPEYGAITLAIGMRANVKTTRVVSKKLFYPMPKVDSAIVNIVIDDNKHDIKDRRLLSRLIKAGFAMRRKTLVNNMASSFPLSKEDAKNILIELGYNENIRGEVLSIADYIKIAENIAKYI